MKDIANSNNQYSDVAKLVAPFISKNYTIETRINLGSNAVIDYANQKIY